MSAFLGELIPEFRWTEQLARELNEAAWQFRCATSDSMLPMHTPELEERSRGQLRLAMLEFQRSVHTALVRAAVGPVHDLDVLGAMDRLRLASPPRSEPAEAAAAA